MPSRLATERFIGHAPPYSMLVLGPDLWGLRKLRPASARRSHELRRASSGVGLRVRQTNGHGHQELALPTHGQHGGGGEAGQGHSRVHQHPSATTPLSRGQLTDPQQPRAGLRREKKRAEARFFAASYPSGLRTAGGHPPSRHDRPRRTTAGTCCRCSLRSSRWCCRLPGAACRRRWPRPA